jgi:hypothetical protein
VRAALARAAIGAALIALAAGAGTSAAQAQTAGSDSGGMWNRIMQSVGLRPKAVEGSSSISYTERSPLVVPPTRDLPPPGTVAAIPTPDWPRDPAKQSNRPKAKPGVVPGTAVDTPNPVVQKKPWYDPAGWFNKEEYAKFAGEPMRENLTDPPAGYRIPSPDQPYGIAPEKKKAKTKATSSDLNMGSAAPSGH